MNEYDVTIQPREFTVHVKARTFRKAIRAAARVASCGTSVIASLEQTDHSGDGAHRADVAGLCESCSGVILELQFETGPTTYEPLYGTDNDGVMICRECWPDDWDWPARFGAKPEKKPEPVLREVDMIQAFRWLCLDCEQENFDRAETVTFSSEEEEREAREALGVEPDDEGAVISIPGTVTCLGCLAMFRTKSEYDEIDEEG